MKEVFWIEPSRLGGRPGPSRRVWNPQELHASGIRAILNVSEHAPTADSHDVGIDVLWLPLPVSVPPDDGDEDVCLQALPKAAAFIADHLASGNPVLVHCVAGRDRTGLVLAYHLAVTEGLTPEDAIARVRAVRPEALTADGWEALARRVITFLGNAQ